MSRILIRCLGALLPVIALVVAASPVKAQSTYTWNTTTTSNAWLTPSNWTGGTPAGVFPGTTSNLSLPNGHALDTATFGTFASAIGTNGVGIDFASANLQLGIGAVQLTTGTGGNLRMGNSSATIGDIFLNGTTVNSVASVVLANTSGSRNLTLDNTPAGAGSQTMRLVIGTIPTSVFLVTSGGSITVNSVIFESAFHVSGSGFVIQGGGTVVLTGTNLFNGSVAVTGSSTLSVAQDANFGNVPTNPSPGKIVLDSGTLNITTGFTLNLRRGIAIGPTSGSGSGTISIANGQTLTYAGIIANNGGTGSLIKTGAGTLTLAGVNTYAGATTINAGTLSILAPGSLAAASAVAVNNSGRLSGTGTVNGTVTIASGGILAPGTNGAGTLTIRGNTAINAAGRISFGVAAPGTSSRVSFQGSSTTVNFAPGSIIELTSLSGFGASGNYNLLTMPAGSGGNILFNGTPTPSGPVLGTFVQGTGPSGDLTISPSGFTLSTGDTFTLRRTGDTLVLSFQPVPEMGVPLGISAAGLALLAVVRRSNGRGVFGTKVRG